MQSCSSNKLIKPKAVMVHQFASTANLKQKTPLTDYNFNIWSFEILSCNQ